MPAAGLQPQQQQLTRAFLCLLAELNNPPRHNMDTRTHARTRSLLNIQLGLQVVRGAHIGSQSHSDDCKSAGTGQRSLKDADSGWEKMGEESSLFKNAYFSMLLAFIWRDKRCFLQCSGPRPSQANALELAVSQILI